MPRVADGVVPSTASSNKIAPVEEVDPPPTEKKLLSARAGVGPEERQSQLAPPEDELGKFSPLEKIGTATSLGSEDVVVGDDKAKNSLPAGSDNGTSRGKRLQTLAI